MGASVEQRKTILAHVPCSGCGYDIFGCPVDGECPECGAAIAASRDRLRLVFAPRAHLVGFAWIAAINIFLVAGVLAFSIPVFWPKVPAPRSAIYLISGATAVASQFAALALLTSAIVLLRHLVVLTEYVWLAGFAHRSSGIQKRIRAAVRAAGRD